MTEQSANAHSGRTNAPDAQRLEEKLTDRDQFIDHLVKNLSLFTREDNQGLPVRTMTGSNLSELKQWIEQAHQFLKNAGTQDVNLAFASEWILDNFYIIRQNIQQVQEDLTENFYNELPKFPFNKTHRIPRIYFMARNILAFQNLLLDVNSLEEIMISVQKHIPLSMGEIWALPIFLRYSLLEFLAQALVRTINPPQAPALPEPSPLFPGINDPFSEDFRRRDNAISSNGIANIILSLRSISEMDWKDFFESVSCLEQILRQDPANIYPKMDFKTRDLYRDEVEKLAHASGYHECELAELLIHLASTMRTDIQGVPTSGLEVEPNLVQNHQFETPEKVRGEVEHVGEFLFGNLRSFFESKIGYRPDFKTSFRNWVFKHATVLYLSAIIGLSAILLTILAVIVRIPELIQGDYEHYINDTWELARNIAGTPFMIILAVILGIALVVPVLTITTSLINWLITILFPPQPLPKMQYKEQLPSDSRTIIVIPGLISSRRDIDSLVSQLEMHYLRNPEPGFQFAILTDFSDSDLETQPEDKDLLSYGKMKITSLNQKYEAKSVYPQDDSLAGLSTPNIISARFFFLHRRRLWNPSEGKWMGWERKRGKLHELNQYLRGSQAHTFVTVDPINKSDDLSNGGIQYVITLDADTILPIGAAKRLVGAMSHPLNRPVFSEKTGQVVSGYTILQPRMEIHPKSTNQTWFSQLFAGDAGLDLYTLAVSDAYQDLFGEGIYVGKGIYDVDAFERSVDSHIPENTVLSHDLLEGNMGRAGLVTDITMVEDYPPNYLTMALRQRRWIRGDWQLLPWLFKSTKNNLGFNLLDRWKIFDNLRRSLLAPSLMVIFVLGLLFLPGLTALWTITMVTSLGFPLLTGLTRSALQIMGGESIQTSLRPIGWMFLRWILAISFLVYEAYIATDAIITTLYRLFFSRKNLLQWTTAAQTARLFKIEKRRSIAWQKMAISVLFALILTLGVQIISDMAWSGIAPALISAAMILLLWMLSPIIVFWINRPIVENIEPLSAEQIKLVRQVARRTWAYFERFVGPEDHWLPPDHYQETPAAMVAHRTSPTNIGLLLTSTLAAFDFGYLNHYGLVTRWMMTMDSLAHLERYRGHFLNWYNTLTREPLNPRYVSTVDSGNLAASFIVVAEACRKMEDAPVFRWLLWQGYLDSLNNLLSILSTIRSKEFRSEIKKLNGQITDIQQEITSVRDDAKAWYPLFLKVKGPFWTDLTQGLLTLIDTSRNAFDQERLAQLNEITTHLGWHHNAVERAISDLLPWIAFLNDIPNELSNESYAPLLNQLSQDLPLNVKLCQLEHHIDLAIPTLNELIQKLESAQLQNKQVEGGVNNPSGGPSEVARDWLVQFLQELQRAKENAQELLSSYRHIGTTSEKYLLEMDFRFLYNTQRRVFHIGFNLDAGLLDNNFYDLLASEARIASLIAIAKRDVPQSHWVYLSRPVVRVESTNTLLSWSGTMFEYLMPPLFLRSYPGTLLSDSARGAVKHQIAYARSKNVPWGISESGFYRFDAGQSYQYRAFGVPGLGFKRGLSEDLVIAPYASLMAINLDPHAVLKNVRNLISFDMFGLYGFYEALDFTSSRLLINQKAAIVGEYMAHHQGMALMALDNFLNGDAMVKRMHNNALMNSVELLLQEQVPAVNTSQDQNVDTTQSIRQFEKQPTVVHPWVVPVKTPIPQLHLISNGEFNTVISNMGAGYTTWRGTDLTRWQPDPVLDPWGNWLYVQELVQNQPKPEKLWSASYQPIPEGSADFQVSFHAHMAVFRRIFDQIVTLMEVTVAPEDPVEIRRFHLINNSDRPRTIRLTSYGEAILTPSESDARHPAFNKLFIESEYVAEHNLQIFSRRPRSNDEAPLFLGHMLFVQNETSPIYHEADREKFIGRTRGARNPLALLDSHYLSGSSGATFDPIFSLGTALELAPHEHRQMVFLTFAADSREDIVGLAKQYQNGALIERSYHQANINNQSRLSNEGIEGDILQDILKTFSALVFSSKYTRAADVLLAANQSGQSTLWRFGVSGDFPILLVSIKETNQLDILREALMVYGFLRSRRYKIDLVILNQQHTNYGAELNGLINRLIRKMNNDDFLNLRGGIFLLYEDQLSREESILLFSAARVVLRGENGSLHDQLPDYTIPVIHLPDFTPSRAVIPNPIVSLNPFDDLQFFNGYGGFNADGSEYCIQLNPGNPTPAPWVNVIGYPLFGTLVTESGSQTTWSINSGENRLTPWSNDPVRDPSGEVLYLRDEETGEFWSATPLPANSQNPFQIRHGAGYSVFEHHSHGLHHNLTIFASPSDPVKVIRLELTNKRDWTRRITATQYVEWVLGTIRSKTSQFILSEFDPATESLLAINPYSAEFSERVAFLGTNKPIHGMTADRTEFLGRAGSLASPAALKRLGLEKRISPGEDPCAVLQIHIDLPPGSTEVIYFFIGQGKDREEALTLVNKYHSSEEVDQAFRDTRKFWGNLLNTIQIETPDPAIDLMLNRWSLYQALSCRIWGRSAFYQSSGAYGFRDQLQDVLAVLSVQPDIARRQILRAAAHQFEEGDVLHWWHPPGGRGVRTRFSDDLLWLPYVTAHYLQATGDTAILAEEVPFLKGPLLAEGEDERYGSYEKSERTYPLYEHCLRAIQKGSTWGIHQLPLIGTGDWNDGLNRVGEKGRGESIWLAWFLIDILRRFSVVCDQQGDHKRAEEYRDRAEAYARAINENGWDGDWYRRGYYDNGRPLGSRENLEGKIDAIAQSWAILSGGGSEDRIQTAMNSVLEFLVKPEDRLLLLFTPPFDQTIQNPGYIKGYLPGIRENGGQYTHAAIWTVWAFTDLLQGNRAGDLFNLLSPIYQADTKEKANQYRVEPYVICADIYSQEPYVRRGGWTWYTGSAAWYYRLGIEAIAGFQKTGETLVVNPVIPAEWDDFRLFYRYHDAEYVIQVKNPDHVESGIREVIVDGEPISSKVIPLQKTGGKHLVTIILGKDSALE